MPNYNWVDLFFMGILNRAVIENYIQTAIRFLKILVHVFAPELNMFRLDFREQKHIHVSSEKILDAFKKGPRTALGGESIIPFFHVLTVKREAVQVVWSRHGCLCSAFTPNNSQTSAARLVLLHDTWFVVTIWQTKDECVCVKLIALFKTTIHFWLIGVGPTE